MKINIRRKDSAQVRLAKKSFILKVRRKDKYYIYDENHAKNTGKRALEYHKSRVRLTDEIEGFCAINKLHLWSTVPATLRFDQDLAISRNPNRVLKELLILLRHAKTLKRNPRLMFLGSISFGALYLFDTLCWEIGKKRKWVVNHPDLPEDEVKILRSLKSNVSAKYEDENEYLINERVRINRTTGDSGNQPYYVKAKEITDMVERAIGESQEKKIFSMPKEVSQAINSTIGEQFDNITLHAPNTELGTLCGFYNKRKREISILIFNFGPTIFQTLKNAELPNDISNMFEDFLKHFKLEKVKDLKTISNNHTIESLYTLLGIQEGISSKLNEDLSRGHGLIDFIESVKTLNKKSKISIISGNTAILINENTNIVEKFLLDRDRKLLTLNSSGSLFNNPNEDNIKHLKYTFPGVLFETIIPIEEAS